MRMLIRLLILIGAWLALMGMPLARENEQQVEEYTAKALYIFNFARFTEWPSAALADKDSSILLCVYGADPFDTALDPIKGKPIKGRTLEVKYIKRGSSLKECHILFVSESEQLHLKQIVSLANRQQILSVSDMSGFAKGGGIIGLVPRQNKIRFEININAAERAGLTISSKLLNLATIVEE